jgi:uncharacterized MAPEG superfamily protein
MAMMIFPYWMLLIGGLLPYTVVQIARGPAFNNSRPRDTYDGATGRQKRAYGAEVNSFEVFPFFAVAVLVALQAGMQSTVLNVLAAAWVVSRIVYIVAYLNDRASLRSLVWGIGLLLVVGILTMPLWGPFLFNTMETSM